MKGKPNAVHVVQYCNPDRFVQALASASAQNQKGTWQVTMYAQICKLADEEHAEAWRNCCIRIAAYWQ